MKCIGKGSRQRYIQPGSNHHVAVAETLRSAEALLSVDDEVFEAVLNEVILREDAIRLVGLSSDEQKRRLAKQIADRRRRATMLDEPLYGVKGHTVGDVRFCNGELLRTRMPSDEWITCEVWRRGKWVEDGSFMDDWMKGVPPNADQLDSSGLAKNRGFLEDAELLTDEVQ